MKMKHIYIFSDSTGETGERIVRATLSQFDHSGIFLHKKSHLRTIEDIAKAIGAVAQNPGLILHTLVDMKHAEYISMEAERLGVTTIDLITPVLSEMKGFLDLPAKHKPGLLYLMNDEYLRRMDAINFTVAHDDGQLAKDLSKADIVLVGLSRTSKTPLSMYLAHRGYKVANIPLIPDVEPPEELFQVDQERIVGLTINVERLVSIRMARLSKLGHNIRDSYANFERVETELAYARQLFRKNPKWLVIDMTNRAIEEAAGEILKKIEANDNGNRQELQAIE
jgi:regulator of PEP synthase PpsR (kinase-PPPase family)